MFALKYILTLTGDVKIMFKMLYHMLSDILFEHVALFFSQAIHVHLNQTKINKNNGRRFYEADSENGMSKYLLVSWIFTLSNKK